MRQTLAIMKKEWRSYFYSPVGYIIIALFVILTGVFYYLYLNTFVQMCVQASFYEMQYRGFKQSLNINYHMIRPFVYNVAIISLFILPLISMRLFSEEKRQGTIELLFTVPVHINQIVLGKFLAGLSFYAILLLAPLFYILLLFFFGNPELGQIFVAFAGLIFLGSVIIGWGLFISTMTENQIVSATATFALSLLLWIIGWGASYSGKMIGSVLEYLSVINHFEDFSKGVLDTQHIAYYLLISFLGLYLAKFSLESTRWRS